MCRRPSYDKGNICAKTSRLRKHEQWTIDLTVGPRRREKFQKGRNVPNTIVHFEIPGDDVPALQTFYQSIFDWQIEKMSMGDVDYWGVTTTPQGQPGANGGMMARNHPGEGITLYVGVDSCEETAKKAQAQGGQVLVPTSPIPGIGYFAVLQDPQGNTFGIFQSDESVTVPS